MSRPEIVPITLGEAYAFVDRHHRHHKAPPGAIFAVGLATEEVVGVVIVGLPVAAANRDDFTAEVSRLCVAEGVANGCSMLYAAAWRAARGMGYRKLITYTLATEPGTSLRAAGWRVLHQTKGGTWNRPSRPRVDKHPLQAKLCWEVSA